VYDLERVAVLERQAIESFAITQDLPVAFDDDHPGIEVVLAE
jgi:hypothetical protein